MQKKQFEISKLILSNFIFDNEIDNWLCNISYHQDGNNLLVETPQMSIEKVTLVKNKRNPKLIVYASIIGQNDQFSNTIKQIETFTCNYVGNNRAFKEKNISRFFKPINNEKNIYKFFIPIYHNEINILISDNNSNILSIKDLKCKSKFKAILYLSHLEFEKKYFYLNWNIIQLKLE